LFELAIIKNPLIFLPNLITFSHKKLILNPGGTVSFQDVIIIFFFIEIINSRIVCAVAEEMSGRTVFEAYGVYKSGL
jgi:hypothetical protein